MIHDSPSLAGVTAPLWAFHCPTCRARGVLDTEDAAMLTELFHRCEEDDMTAGPSLVEQAWAQLDDQMDELADAYGKDPREVAEMKGRARGKAEILALFMSPHFRTADDVRDEAVRRWQARQSGDTTYETKGLGSRRGEF